MLSEEVLQLTVWILGSNGISRFAWERDAFLVDGAHFELVEVTRPESLHGVIQVVGVGLKDQVLVSSFLKQLFRLLKFYPVSGPRVEVRPRRVLVIQVQPE